MPGQRARAPPTREKSRATRARRAGSGRLNVWATGGPLALPCSRPVAWSEAAAAANAGGRLPHDRPEPRSCCIAPSSAPAPAWPAAPSPETRPAALPSAQGLESRWLLGRAALDHVACRKMSAAAPGLFLRQARCLGNPGQAPSPASALAWSPRRWRWSKLVTASTAPGPARHPSSSRPSRTSMP